MKQCLIHDLPTMSWGKVSLGVNVHHVKSGGHPITSVALFSELLFSVTKTLSGPPNPRPESEKEREQYKYPTGLVCVWLQRASLFSYLN